MGRILAEKLGMRLRCSPLPGFRNTYDVVDGDVHLGPELVLSGNVIPFADLTQDTSPKRIILDGFFQRAEYYRPFERSIKHWLAFDPAHQPRHRPDIFVHVRRTDYVEAGWALPFAYYEQALNLLWSPGLQVTIGTDDPDDPFLRNFRPWAPRIFDGSDIEQLALMAAAHRLVMSQSTYSWWAAFLGTDQTAVCPVPSHGCWAGDQDITRDIRLIEPDRFICISCPDAYHAEGLERCYQQWRSFKRLSAMRLHRFLRLPIQISER